jgi:hypothetical protein
VLYQQRFLPDESDDDIIVANPGTNGGGLGPINVMLSNQFEPRAILKSVNYWK